MTSRNNIIAAIDIGTTKIVAIMGEVDTDGRLRIIGMEKTVSRGVKRGVIHSIEDTIGAISEVVDRLAEKTNKDISTVYVGIAGQHIRSIKNRQFKYIQNGIGEITKQDVEEIINENFRIPIEVGEQILHVIPQDYVVDKEAGIRNPIGMAGRRLDGNFNIIIGRTASARNIEKCVKEVGLEIEELVLEPLASSLSVLSEEEKEAGVVLVDIGGGTTDITVYFDGILRHTAVIPFGGDIVTRDIKEGCSVLIKQAEALKIQFGEAVADLVDEEKVVTIPSVGGWDPKEISFKTLAQIIQCRMEEIIDSVKFQIEITGLHDKIGAGIVLTGGGALLTNLDVLTQKQTGIDVRIGYPGASSKIILDETLNQPIYATGIGLMLKGLNKPRKKIQNQNTDKNKTGKKKGFQKFFSALFDTDDLKM
ncbi:cell division protein FtsA [Labilibaculum euxinus]|uniref:Cell division protein FtsA n=1 Tax=Labilibaculum euxinus TaxID=2686357 RepID=A0A7M4DA89_9BACT|nr:cell division protein FtsA [Labilibaculum euxinus]MUP39568.1 cell division protein FtsA [Labilibaculum euxinus]MVB08773.1 cell division protein FtsA [Labilibaculum euxinus]